MPLPSYPHTKKHIKLWAGIALLVLVVLLSFCVMKTITVHPPNQAPTVNAGADSTIDSPNSASLSGTATDDGNPSGSTVSVTWSKNSGDGNVTFSNPNSLTTTAAFTSSGVYVLRLTATDGELSSYDDVAITVRPGNQAPIVSAGNDQTITLPFSSSLNGTVTDDGNPPGSTVAITWSKAAGDGQVTFSNPGNLTTLASFSSPGSYVLRLTATDGSLSTSDELTVMVKPENQAPAVDAGADQTIALSGSANLIGIATDDGMPQGNSFIVSWSKISDNGEVSFSSPGSLSTGATFSEPGIYILRLSATDGDLVSSDDVAVTVNRANQAPIVNAGEDKIVALPSGSFQLIQNDLPQFNQLSAVPPIAVDFDDIPSGTDITGNTFAGILFEAGNSPSASAPLIVVRLRPADSQV